jgi:hypothetical protein
MIRIPASSNPHVRTALIALAVILALLLAVKIVFRLGEQQYERELYQWKTQLDREANRQAYAIEKWFLEQFVALETIAQQDTLRFELKNNPRQAPNTQPEAPSSNLQISPTESVLISQAERTGFLRLGLQDSFTTEQNQKPVAAVALLDKNRTLITHSAQMPPLKGKLLQFIRRVLPGEKAHSDVFYDNENRAYIAFAVPVFTKDSEPSIENQIGLIIGMKDLDSSLFVLLDSPTSTSKAK